MGREIRRVPANWQHPTYRTMRLGRDFRGEIETCEIETWKPLLNEDFAAVAAEWDAGNEAWNNGVRPAAAEKYNCATYEEWAGERPNPEYYVPYDVNGDLPWWQMYETVSEGTPVTPAFATAEELIVFLAENGQQYEDGETDGPWGRDAAERFVKSDKWFPSGVIAHGVWHTAKEGWPK